MTKSILSLFGGFLIVANLAIAEEEGNATGFRFRGPEVVKIDWNARALHASDLNGDGLTDLAIVNRERSRIEILYRRKPGEKVKDIQPARPDRWEPVLENAPYVRENLSIDEEVTSLATGDLDADGKVDLIHGGAEDGVYVRFREKDDSWSDPVEVDAGVLRTGVDSLDVRDLDGDGSLELLVHVKKGLEVFRFDDRDPAGKPILYRDDSERSRGLQFADIDGDGHDDWIYLSPGSDRSVRTRLWRKSGFGPECSHAFSSRSGVNLLPRGMHGKGEPSFVAVEADTEKITLFSVSPKNDPPKDSTIWNPLIRDLFGSGDEEASFATADFDGDGQPDIVAASPAIAEILFLRGRPAGSFSAPSAFPSFHGISSLVAGRLYEKGGVGFVVVSSKEKLAGVCRHIRGKRFRFPVDLPLKDDPVEVVCADLDSNGIDEILLVAKERYDYLLHRFVADKKGRFSEAGKVELKGIKRDPSGLLPCDLDGDGNLDVLVLDSRGPALVLRGDGKGKLVPAAESSAIRKSMLADLALSQVGLADVDEDGKLDLLVAGSGFVRAVSLKGNELEVIDQFNSRSGKGEVLAPFALDVLGDPAPEILFYSPENEGFEALSRDVDGVFRYARSFRTGSFDLRRLLLRKVGESPELITFGKSGFRRIPTRETVKMPVLNIHSRYATDLRDVSHDAVDCGDFDSDGQLDLLCLDASRHFLEFLKFDDEKKEWRSVLHFHVFETNLHYQGRKGGASEPREGLVVDLNGDDKDDFILLAHDRLLCYYQE